MTSQPRISSDDLRELLGTALHAEVVTYFDDKSAAPREFVERQVTECLRYLYLVSRHHDRLGGLFLPVEQDIDEIWHYLILQTREYRALCEERLPGQFFIEHRSIAYEDYQQEPGREQALEEALRWIPLYCQEFGPFDEGRCRTGRSCASSTSRWTCHSPTSPRWNPWCRRLSSPVSTGTKGIMTAPNDVTAGREVPEQRRILAVLVFSQILSGAGLAAGITVGALLAEEMLGSTGLAGVPSALFTAGSALGALGVGQICRRYGRRPGLALGYAVGALGSLGVVVAATLGSAVLLFLSLVVYGAGTSTNLMARYAGADLASAERRGRAVSTVLFATTLGAVVGPNLVTFTGEVAHSWGIPRLAGPFLLAVAAFGSAGVVLAALLRPDPLRLAEKLAAERAPETDERPADDVGDLPDAQPQRRGVVIGTTVMILTQLVMIAIMTMTPVHMQAHGHDTQAAGLVIALHVGAMFLPPRSPGCWWTASAGGGSPEPPV